MIALETNRRRTFFALALLCATLALVGCSDEGDGGGGGGGGHHDGGNIDGGGDGAVDGPCANNGDCVHGTCRDDEELVWCDCTLGYYGDRCELDENECDAEPCQNDATCLNTPGSYLCNCTGGWRGDNCEEDIDECAQAEICMNGGTCHNGPGSFICECVEPYHGIICHLGGD